jgi:murein DD-endopeptidase MepM/ murein hydrolase activator NlpD
MDPWKSFGGDAENGTAVCGICESPLLETRYVQTEPWSLQLLCSRACLRDARRAQSAERWAARGSQVKWLAVGVIVIGACLTAHEGPPHPRRVAHASPAPPPPRAPGPPPLPAGWFGPEWPPTETSLLAALGQDAWIHPLAGPVRRMPRSDSRVFGAVRPGERPIECRNGHCGVDLGGEIWGEHVHAVHDGVVDRVQRGPNPDHGGEYVRLSHRDGTVYTQYFHLAAIPRGLERGVAVKGGEVIGLLGDSGVKESEPHLHFTISIRPAKTWPEKYIDPEPLIALWPLRVPLHGTEAGLVTTVGPPGVPLGSAPLAAARRRMLAKRRRGHAEPAAEHEQSSGQPETETEAAAPDDGAAAADTQTSEPSTDE